MSFHQWTCFGGRDEIEMLVNFYGVSRFILSIWDIGMVCEGLYIYTGNSVVSPQNPGGAGRKMKHDFLVLLLHSQCLKGAGVLGCSTKSD